MESAAPDSAPAPATGGYIPLPSAPVGGRRHMKKVSAKTIRRTLKKLGMKPKGRVVLKGGEGMDGAPAPAPAPEPQTTAGRRHRRGGKTARKHKRSSFPF